ncbi:MAG: type II toxin-antitoxin system RelE/ParE family toxin [Hyphomicrobium sp.]
MYCYTLVEAIIKSFKSKALERFWTRNDQRGVRRDQAEKVAERLTALNAARTPSDLDLPGFGFHRLTGNLAGRYALKVSRNWRITFGWDEDLPDAVDIDYEDYH